MKIISRLLKLIHRTEDIIIGLLLIGLISVGVLQILLRNFLDTGILWNEPLTRVLVLWAALAGAMVASRYDKHIQIDLLGRFLGKSMQINLQKLIHLISSAICLFVAYIAINFVIEEYQYGDIAFGVVKAWVAELIIPIAFAVIGLRFFARIFLPAPLSQEQN